MFLLSWIRYVCLFARSTFSYYFTGEREMFKFQFSIDIFKKFVLSDFDVYQLRFVLIYFM